MRIVYFAPTSSLYGDNIALLNILRVLSFKNVEFIIITSREGDFTRKLRELGYKYALFKFDTSFWPFIKSFRDLIFFLPRLFYYKFYLSSSFNTSRLVDFVSEFEPDIIHSNNSCFKLGLIVAKKLNVPHVQHIREYGKLDMNRSYFMSLSDYVRSISKGKNQVLCITNNVKKYFLRSKSLSNWHVVYDGVINGQCFYDQSKDPYFLYVGRLFPGKGVLELLKQYASFIHSTSSNVRFKIVGSGDASYECLLKQAVLDYNIVDHVDFLGYCSDVYPFMRKALALFVPSYFEGFGFITVEAMLSGCLVVGRDTGGTKEQFDRGLELMKEEIGLRFSKDDELVDIMKTLSLNSVQDFIPMIQRAQKVIMNSYTVDISANSVYDCYIEVLRRKNCV